MYKYENNNNESFEFEAQPKCNNNKPGTRDKLQPGFKIIMRTRGGALCGLLELRGFTFL